MNKINFRYFLTEVRKAEDGGRKLTFVASDGTRDSAHTVLNVDGWDLRRFNSNGIIGYQHKVYGGFDDTDNPDNVIGKGQAYVEGKRLMVDVEFEPAEINPLAEKIYQKLMFGSLKAVSVGFLPVGRGSWGDGEEARGEANETYYYAGQELLEVSVVNIPSNPKALRRAMEAQEEELAELRAEADSDLEEEETCPPVEESVTDPATEPAEETVEKDPAEDRVLDLEIRKRLTIAGAALL